MSSSIKINSISIDLAGAANEINMVKCDHFSIRGFVAETRERDHRKCWPFSEESVTLENQQSYPLPSLSVPKFRWWRCMSCIKDINADGIKGLHANSTSISGEKLDETSSVIPSQSKLNPLTITDQEKERDNDIAGRAVVENENVNCERAQKDDQTVTATTLVKKVHPPSMDASTVRNKIRKLASREQVGNKRSKVSKSSTDTSSWKEKQNVTTFASSEIAGVVEDTPPKAIKNRYKDDKVSSESINLGFQRRKTRKVRLLSELIVDPETKANGGSNNIRQEESSSSSKARGRKRKVPPENNYVSRKLSKGGATSDQGDSDSADSGFDRDLIKGKKKNRRFQVVDEFVPSLPSQEGVHENDAAGSSKSALSKDKDSVPQRAEKKLKKKKNKPVIKDNEKSSLISFSSINTISQSTRDLLNEERVGNSLDDRLAAEGYFRKPIPPQVNNDRPVTSLHVPENAHVRPRDVEANSLQEFGSSSRPNTGGWLRTGVDAVDFSTTNNNSTDKGFADLFSVLQKEASGADRKGKTVMVQEHHEPLGSQSHDRNENTPEEANDDITLEIAELMAKNQYERCLPDKEDDVSNKQPPQEETPHRSKNALLIDLNETYDNETSLEDTNNNTSKPQQKPLDFFPLRQPYVPSSPFGIFPPPTQENRPNSIRFSSGHNNPQWLGNVPTTMANQHPSPSSYRVLRGCNTCYQSVPHQYREPASSHQIWPPSIVQRPQCHHQTPVSSFNMDQSTRLGPSNNNTWNLNFVTPNGKQRCDGNRSMDAFSNESSIPALNLLSLMDPRLRSSNAPVDHHGNANFTRRHFPPSKERIGLETGDSSKTAYPSKQSPFNFYSNGFAPEASRKSFPIGPPLGTSSFSFQNAQAAPWSHHHHHQEKINKSKDTVFPGSNDQGRFQLLRGSNSMKLPLKEMNQKRKAESSSNASALPPKNSSGSFECIVNRNPADFTVAEPGNVYMLTSENLKVVRKRAPYKTKASLCKEDAMKQTKKTVGPVTENA